MYIIFSTFGSYVIENSHIKTEAGRVSYKYTPHARGIYNSHLYSANAFKKVNFP